MTGTGLDELLAWRDRAVEDRALAAGAIKDAQLSQIVRSNRRSVAEIERMLPRSARPMAAQIAQVLAGEAPATEPTSYPTPDAAPGATSAAGPGSLGGSAPLGVDPVAEPGRTSGRPAQRRAADEGLSARGTLELGQDDFCEFEYGESDHEIAELVIKPVGGGHSYLWPTFAVGEGEVVVYRVIVSENSPAYKPEAGHLVAATQALSATDARPTNSAVRHVQVWCHVGGDVREAAANQPILIAKGQVVSGVSDFVITEEEGAVIGQWSAWPGVSAVRVLRIPLDGASGGSDAQYRIATHEQNLTGFVDREAERGKRYLYRAVCEVQVDGVTRLSKPEQEEVLLSVVLAPVTDLRVSGNSEGDTSHFDLEWTNPTAGRVVVYRTDVRPKAGIGDAALAPAALASGGLPESAELKYPTIAITATSSGMRGVPVPREWSRAYFTPVTVLGETVQVGETTGAARPLAAVTNPKLIERCFEQILTFGWPDGAASISVFVSRQDVPLAQVLSQAPTAEISKGAYERDGGLHLPMPLHRGAVVHVVPVAYASGRRLMGEAVSVAYPGLMRIWYRLQSDATPTTPPARVAISLQPEYDNSSSPPFVLVHNRDRLPLSVEDGYPLTVQSASGGPGPGAKSFRPARLAAADRDVKWIANIAGLTGYIRLFVEIDSARMRSVALIDPIVDVLRLPPPGMQA